MTGYTISNDTGVTYLCSLHDAGENESTFREIVSSPWLGLGLAAMGLAVVPPPVGALLGAGATALYGGLVGAFGVMTTGATIASDALEPSDNVRQAVLPLLLMPERSASKTSDAGMDVTITRLTVDAFGHLLFETFTHRQLASGAAVAISSLLHGAQWRRTLDLGLPCTVASVETRALIAVKGLKPVASGNSRPNFFTDKLNNEPTGSLYTYKSGDGAYAHGTWADGLQRLVVAPSTTLYLLTSPSAGWVRQLGDNGVTPDHRPLLLWTLNGFSFDGNKEAVSSRPAASEDEARAIISENPDYDIYSWGDSVGDYVYGLHYSSSHLNRIGHAQASRATVFVKVTNEMPFLKIV